MASSEKYLLSAILVCSGIYMYWISSHFNFIPNSYGVLNGLLRRFTYNNSEVQSSDIKNNQPIKAIRDLNTSSHDTFQSITYKCVKACWGWNDRVRGMICLYVISILTGRRFYINHSYPCDLGYFVDLSNQTWVGKMPPGKQQRWKDDGPDGAARKRFVELTNIEEVLNNTQHVQVTTNINCVDPLLKNPIYSRQLSQLTTQATAQNVTLFSMLFNKLFNFGSGLEKAKGNFLSEVKKGHGSLLVCAHVRIGDSSTMRHKVRSWGIKAVQELWRFLHTFQKNNHTKFFIATDSEEVRKDAKIQFGKHHIDNPGHIMHVDRVKHGSTDCDGMQKAILDHICLTYCDVLVVTLHGWYGRSAACLRNTLRDLYLLNGTSISRITEQNYTATFGNFCLSPFPS